jgi:hypothetical protein
MTEGPAAPLLLYLITAYGRLADPVAAAARADSHAYFDSTYHPATDPLPRSFRMEPLVNYRQIALAIHADGQFDFVCTGVTEPPLAVLTWLGQVIGPLEGGTTLTLSSQLMCRTARVEIGPANIGSLETLPDKPTFAQIWADARADLEL